MTACRSRLAKYRAIRAPSRFRPVLRARPTRSQGRRRARTTACHRSTFPVTPRHRGSMAECAYSAWSSAQRHQRRPLRPGADLDARTGFRRFQQPGHDLEHVQAHVPRRARRDSGASAACRAARCPAPPPRCPPRGRQCSHASEPSRRTETSPSKLLGSGTMRDAVSPCTSMGGAIVATVSKLVVMVESAPTRAGGCPSRASRPRRFRPRPRAALRR